MTGDLVSNWEFFRDSRMNYATATKLADNDKKLSLLCYYQLWGGMSPHMQKSSHDS